MFFFVEITIGTESPVDGMGYRIVSPFTISKNIDRYYDMEKVNFITELSSIMYVCVTSDIWPTRHTSYMGVTIHWINRTTMKMMSKLLCCRHFVSPHTSARIAALIQDILEEYGITNKVRFDFKHFLCCVTAHYIC